MIARSPTPPETDDEADDGEEWPVHGIVGEDVDVFGVSRYDRRYRKQSTSHFSSLFSVMRQAPTTLLSEFITDLKKKQKKQKQIRWKNWSRPDGTNTTWMRTIDDPALVDSWNDEMKYQRQQKANESQSVDLTLLPSTPMHDRLTFERAQAVEEKMAERLRRNGGVPGKSYQGWTTEVERQVARHERQRRPDGDKKRSSQSSSSARPASKNRGRQPSPDRCVGVLS